MNPLETRIQKIEKQNSLLIKLIIIIAIAFCVLLLLGAKSMQKIPDEIVAHSIRIVNDQGKNSAQLVATPDGFVGLFFTDLNGESRFGVMMTPSGKATIDFSNKQRVRLQLGVADGKNGEEYTLVLKDRDGNPIWQLPVSNPY